MTKPHKLIALIIATALLFSGCSDSSKPHAGKYQNTGLPQSEDGNNTSGRTSTSGSGEVFQGRHDTTIPGIDLNKIKPDETGKIMIVMFHNFTDSFTPTKSDDGQYTTTYGEFGKLLETLYEKGYRLINLSDYLYDRISVPAGFIPIIFTFDDGSRGQFNLVEDSGGLAANPQSAVGVMEDFYRKHPDFGLKGTFYVNLGMQTFEGKRSVGERLKYLVDRGFEIGNHTMSHANLRELKTSEAVRKEVGGNQKLLDTMLPGYVMNTLAMPYGGKNMLFRDDVLQGEYEGSRYQNLALMEVGAEPAASPSVRGFDPTYLKRVRATGIKAVECDLNWWLQKLTREDQYVSDGNPDTVTVPKAREALVDTDRLGERKLVSY